MTEAITELLNGAPKFVNTATKLVESFLGSVKDNGPEIMDGALNVIMTLIDGFVSMLPDIIDTAIILIGAFIQGIISRIPQILAAAVKIIGALLAGLLQEPVRFMDAAGQLIANILRAFANTDWIQVGKDVVLGIANGLMGAASYLYERAKRMAKNVLKSLKGAFDSHSPSKEAKKIGDTVPQGLEKAFDEDDLAEDAARNLGSRAIAGLTADVNYNIPDVSEYAKDLTSGFSGSYKAGAEITVPLYLDGREVARASAWWTGEQLSWEEM